MEHASIVAKRGIQSSHLQQSVTDNFNSHSKADCPNPAKPRPCFNCGEEGYVCLGISPLT